MKPYNVTLAVLAGTLVPGGDASSQREAITQFKLRIQWPGRVLILSDQPIPMDSSKPDDDLVLLITNQPNDLLATLQAMLTHGQAMTNNQMFVVTRLDMTQIKRMHLSLLSLLLESNTDKSGVVFTGNDMNARPTPRPMPMGIHTNALPLIQSLIASEQMDINGFIQNPTIAKARPPRDWARGYDLPATPQQPLLL